jgi:hypothetical protein
MQTILSGMHIVLHSTCMSFKIKALTHTRGRFSALPHTHRGFLEGTEVAGEEGRGRPLPLALSSHSPIPLLLSPFSPSLFLLFFTTSVLQVHKREIFLYFFCRNRNIMVPRACITRFLKIVFDSAEIFNF